MIQYRTKKGVSLVENFPGATRGISRRVLWGRRRSPFALFLGPEGPVGDEVLAQFVPAKANSPAKGGKDSSLGVLCPVESAREQLQGRPRRTMSGLEVGEESEIEFRKAYDGEIEVLKSAAAPVGHSCARASRGIAALGTLPEPTGPEEKSALRNLARERRRGAIGHTTLPSSSRDS
jgi:hypothetical protein